MHFLREKVVRLCCATHCTSCCAARYFCARASLGRKRSTSYTALEQHAPHFAWVDFYRCWLGLDAVGLRRLRHSHLMPVELCGYPSGSSQVRQRPCLTQRRRVVCSWKSTVGGEHRACGSWTDLLEPVPTCLFEGPGRTGASCSPLTAFSAFTRADTEVSALWTEFRQLWLEHACARDASRQPQQC